MKQLLIDGAAVESRAQLHALLAEGLRLPGYYGRNLDALNDCLTDPADEDIFLTIADFPALKASLGDYADRFVHVLFHAARQNKRLHIRLQ